MKAIRLFIVLNVLLGSLSLNSCGSDEKIEIPAVDNDTELYIQVPIGFSGEITDITETSLVRAVDGTKDYYVFQVYFRPEEIGLLLGCVMLTAFLIIKRT